MRGITLWQQKRIGDGHWSAFGHLYAAAFTEEKWKNLSL